MLTAHLVIAVARPPGSEPLINDTFIAYKLHFYYLLNITFVSFYQLRAVDARVTAVGRTRILR